MCVFFPPHKARHAAGSAFSVIFPFATYCNRIHGNRTVEIDWAFLTHLAEKELYFNAEKELINSVGFGEKLKPYFKMLQHQRTELTQLQAEVVWQRPCATSHLVWVWGLKALICFHTKSPSSSLCTLCASSRWNIPVQKNLPVLRAVPLWPVQGTHRPRVLVVPCVTLLDRQLPLQEAL